MNTTIRTRKPRGRAVPDAEPLAITPSRRRVLELLARYRYLSADLLGHAYSTRNGRGEKHARNLLSGLFHNHLVRRYYHPTRPAGDGSDQYVYSLGPDGARAVMARDEWLAQRAAIYRRGEEKRIYDHLLAVSTLQLILEHGRQPWELEEFVSDHEDQEAHYVVDVPGLGKQKLWPDAEAIVRFPNGARALYLFEVDRAHRSHRRTDQRFRGYAALMTGRSSDKIKTARGVTGIVAVFVEPGAAKVRSLIIRAHGLMTGGTIPPPRPLFLFWNSDAWFEKHDGGRRLRRATEILADDSVLGLNGKRRQLVQVSS
jgi:hypothetical protein